MGKILSGYLFPHPPIVVEGIGKGEEVRAQKTIEGSQALAKDIGNKKPTTIIVITPHGPLFRDALSISVSEELEGDFRRFGNGSIKYRYKNNLELVERIAKESSLRDIPIAIVDKGFARRYGIDLKLDHGSLVPLYFVDKEYKDFKLIHITYGLLSPLELFEFGRILQRVALESHEDVALIASGDLSHKLSHDGPYPYSPYGEKFDNKIVSILKEADFKSIVSFDLSLSEKAGECGLRSLMVLAGFLDGYRIEAEVLSYEGPFGVGYCNAKFEVIDRDDSRNIQEELINMNREKMDRIREKEDEYVRLARKSLEHYVRYNERISVPEYIGEEMLNKKQGVFVTLKKDGMLRGCIGTVEPRQKNVAEEIIENAISAGTKDPRFDPVTEEELDQLVYSVDVLMEPEPITSIEELDVKRYGLIVSKGYRRGLLLPNIEGVDTPEEQVRIALNKAGIDEGENYEMQRFEVIRHN